MTTNGSKAEAGVRRPPKVRTVRIRGYRAGCAGHDVTLPTRLYAVYSTSPDGIGGGERLRATALTGREAQARAKEEAQCGWVARIVRLTGDALREAQDCWAAVEGQIRANAACRTADIDLA